MAVDSRDKRASVLGLGLAALVVLPAPGTLDQADRQHVAYCYRGITADLPPLASTIAITAWYDPTITLVAIDDSTIRLTGRYDATITLTGEF
jgi:hypothetical protein